MTETPKHRWSRGMAVGKIPFPHLSPLARADWSAAGRPLSAQASTSSPDAQGTASTASPDAPAVPSVATPPPLTLLSAVKPKKSPLWPSLQHNKAGAQQERGIKTAAKVLTPLAVPDVPTAAPKTASKGAYLRTRLTKQSSGDFSFGVRADALELKATPSEKDLPQSTDLRPGVGRFSVTRAVDRVPSRFKAQAVFASATPAKQQLPSPDTPESATAMESSSGLQIDSPATVQQGSRNSSAGKPAISLLQRSSDSLPQAETSINQECTEPVSSGRRSSPAQVTDEETSRLPGMTNAVKTRDTAGEAVQFGSSRTAASGSQVSVNSPAGKAGKVGTISQGQLLQQPKFRRETSTATSFSAPFPVGNALPPAAATNKHEEPDERVGQHSWHVPMMVANPRKQSKPRGTVWRSSRPAAETKRPAKAASPSNPTAEIVQPHRATQRESVQQDVEEPAAGEIPDLRQLLRKAGIPLMHVLPQMPSRAAADRVPAKWSKPLLEAALANVLELQQEGEALASGYKAETSNPREDCKEIKEEKLFLNEAGTKPDKERSADQRSRRLDQVPRLKTAESSTLLGRNIKRLQHLLALQEQGNQFAALVT